MFLCADITAKLHNLLVIALVIIRHTHKANRTDRGAENPTGPKLPDFTLYLFSFWRRAAILKLLFESKSLF